MSKRTIGMLACLVWIAWSLAACGEGGGAATAVTSLERPAVPAEYIGKSNPFGSDEATKETGKGLYQKNCATCHGEQGMGDGPAAASLNPKPQPLAANQKNLDDDYLFWRIREGGLRAPFSSAMPSWKAILSEEQIWQVISYMRTMTE
jgi:mono/diheme cytochrome c family protein